MPKKKRPSGQKTKAFRTKQGLLGKSVVVKSKGRTKTELTIPYKTKSGKTKRVVTTKVYYK